MATLLVRKLEPELVELLKRQAASHGRSVEAEHRAIMRTALQPLQPKLDGKELFEMLRDGETWPGTSSPTADGVMIAVSRPTFEPCLASFSTPM